MKVEAREVVHVDDTPPSKLTSTPPHTPTPLVKASGFGLALSP